MASLTVALTCGRENAMSFDIPIPREIQGWKVHDEVKTYTRDTIFEYIDGAGEVYRMYGFRKLEVYRYTKDNEPDIVLEVFDMSTSEDAFGVFAHGREGDEAGIGQGSEDRGGLLCFWKDKYFVSAYAEGESEDARKAVLNLGEAVSDGIPTSGSKPEILRLLPQEGLIENTIRFFHTHVSLNYHYFLADSNILNLDENTDAVLARYERPEGKPLLLLIGYPTEELAQNAFVSFMTAYMPEAPETNMVQTEDGTWVTAKVERDIVAVVFDATNSDQASELLDAVKLLE
jgi:hypothetical protein